MESIIRVLQKIVFTYKSSEAHRMRRNFYVEKEFQRIFIAKFLYIILALTLLSGVAFYLFFNHLIEQNMNALLVSAFTAKKIILTNFTLFVVEIILLDLVIVIIAADRIFKGVEKALMKFEKLSEYIENFDLKKAGSIEIETFRNLFNQYSGLIERYSSYVGYIRENLVSMLNLLQEIQKCDSVGDEKKKMSLLKELARVRCLIDSKLAGLITDKDMDV